MNNLYFKKFIWSREDVNDQFIIPWLHELEDGKETYVERHSNYSWDGSTKQLSLGIWNMVEGPCLDFPFLKLDYDSSIRSDYLIYI